VSAWGDKPLIYQILPFFDFLFQSCLLSAFDISLPAPTYLEMTCLSIGGKPLGNLFFTVPSGHIWKWVIANLMIVRYLFIGPVGKAKC
jgi:hypothetical protein